MYCSLKGMDDLVHYFACTEDSPSVAYDGNEYPSPHTGCSMYSDPSLMRDIIPSTIHSNSSRLAYECSDNSHLEFPHFCLDNGSYNNPMPQQLPPEVEMGNIEYKRTLVNPTPDRFEHLVTQMKWRLTAGGGSAIYRLGVDDNGLVSGLPQHELAKSVQTLRRMACRLNATLHLLRECILPVDKPDQCTAPEVAAEEERKAVEIMICQSPSVNDGKLDVCVAILGGVDAGKSTLIGVLTDGEYDNGHGRARLNLFRHLHEVQSGRTSSSTSQQLGFNSNGQVTNYSRANGSLTRHSIDEVLRTSTQLITLLDLAGHHKYQRTTLSGLARSQPVGALLIISAITGLTTVGLQHAQLAFSLNLPLAVVITKVDQLAGSGTPARNKQIAEIGSNILQQLSRMKAMTRLRNLTVSGSNYWSNFSLDSVKICTKRNEDLPPLFPVSSVTGFGINRLLHFLSCLGLTHPANGLVGGQSGDAEKTSQSDPHQVRQPTCPPGVNPREAKFLASLEWGLQSTFGRQLVPPQLPTPSRNTCFWVNQVFTQVPGVPNPILFGTFQAGQLTLGQRVWLGPDPSGNFRLVQVMSLMRNRQSHSVISAGQTATVAIQFLPLSTRKAAGQLSPAPPCHSHRPLSEGFGHFFLSDDDDHDGNQPVGSNSEKVILRKRLHQVPPSAGSPVRRGMVLLSEDRYRLISDRSDGHLGVAWTVELAITRRLLTFSTAHTNSITYTNTTNSNKIAVLPPLPTPSQRIFLFAGCVVQSVEVVPRPASAGEADGHESKSMNSAETLHLFVNFTRGPEFLEVGRQVIISWSGCAVAVGHVASLHDVIRPAPAVGHQPTPTADWQPTAVASDSGVSQLELKQVHPDTDDSLKESVGSPCRIGRIGDQQSGASCQPTALGKGKHRKRRRQWKK